MKIRFECDSTPNIVVKMQIVESIIKGHGRNCKDRAVHAGAFRDDVVSISVLVLHILSVRELPTSAVDVLANIYDIGCCPENVMVHRETRKTMGICNTTFLREFHAPQKFCEIYRNTATVDANKCYFSALPLRGPRHRPEGPSQGEKEPPGSATARETGCGP